METPTIDIPISKIDLNNGQIEGLPRNPRFIRDERYKALVKSIQDSPEMLKLRELLVVEHQGRFVVIGGNMRLRACRELNHKTIPCKVLPPDIPVGKLREYAMKDNEGYGQTDWDIIANEWDTDELQEWGIEMPMDWNEDDNNQPGTKPKENVCKIVFDTMEDLDIFVAENKAAIEMNYNATFKGD